MALKTEKVFNSFIKGLITEAGPLSFPANASIDEQNFVLNRDGSRSRRLGVDYEDLYGLKDTGFTTTQIEQSKQSFHRWDTAGLLGGLSIGVIRIYNKLWFIDLLKANPSDNFINSGNSITLEGLGNSDIQTDIINTNLVIVSKDLDKPVVLTYDPTTDIVVQAPIDIKVRDVWGLEDGLAIDERPPYQKTESKNEWKKNSSYKVGQRVWYGNNYYEVEAITDGSGTIINRATKGNAGATPPTHTSGSVEYGEILFKFDSVISSVEISSYHRYNLRNQGWAKTIKCNPAGDAIDITGSVNGNYPSNSDNWTLGKNTNPTSGNYEKYEPDRLLRNSQSKFQVAKGAYIIDAFNRGTSRTTEADDTKISSLLLDQEQGRFSSITSYAQRLFYAGIDSNVVEPDSRSPNFNNYVFFTRVVTSNDDLGRCYQEFDPTDPALNEVVASDGGTIQIPDATKIIKIAGGQSSLLVFAENGVWEIYGDTGGFFATSFQVSKVSTNGVLNPNSIVEVNGNFIYWSNAGIYVATAEGASGRFKTESISLTTIQQLYLNIPILAKRYCKGFYDEKENRVRWLYNDSDSYSDTSYVNKYNKELIFDLTLQAFYVNSISSLASNSPYIADYIEIPNFVVGSTETNVLVGTNQVQDSTPDDVVVTIDISANRNSQFSFLTIIGNDFTISKYNNTTFKDWVTADSTGANYSSYLVTGYELFGDIMRNKYASYVFFYLKRTEDGFSLVGSNLELDNQSSCKVQAQWNWANSANSGKWGTEFQAYRLTRNYIPSGTSDTFDYGESVIVTKNKLRGSGKTLSLKIQSETGKDLQIYGWAIPATATQIP